VELGSLLKTSYKNVLISAAVAAVCVVAYVWQEQKEFSFTDIQLQTFVICISALAVTLCVFARGASRIQPPAFFADALRFIGRHTLEIYALELVVFELVVKLVPDLGP
jgi:peptidoglycan/LPS O-acetylase OafA/YrhL